MCSLDGFSSVELGRRRCCRAGWSERSGGSGNRLILVEGDELGVLDDCKLRGVEFGQLMGTSYEVIVRYTPNETTHVCSQKYGTL